MKTRLTLTLLIATAAAAPAAIIEFTLMGTGGPGLLFTNEPNVQAGGSGDELLGGITFDDVTKLLTINVGWGSVNGFTDLSGDSINAHIHGPTALPNGEVGGFDFVEQVGVMINLQNNAAPGFVTNPSASGGGVTGTGTTALTLAQETALLESRTYLNVHTAAAPGGEIRGFLLPIPEPSSALLGAATLGALALRRRRA